MFRYKIRYYDKVEKANLTESGIIAAATYGEAADKIVVIYGKENVGTIGLYELEDWLSEENLREEFDIEFNL